MCRIMTIQRIGKEVISPTLYTVHIKVRLVKFTGMNPGRWGGGGFLGVIKRKKNVVRMHLNTPRFSPFRDRSGRELGKLQV